LQLSTFDGKLYIGVGEPRRDGAATVFIQERSNDVVILILVVLITIFVSAQCSLYEATLYSTRIGSLEAAKSKDRLQSLARQMIVMKKNVAIPIAAILILNTLANTAGATIAGMYAHKVLGSSLVPVFSILFTLAILFIAEIMPKTLGAVYWRNLWPFIVWPVMLMKYSLYPFIMVTQKFTELLTRGRSTPPITEEEILGVIRLGAKEGEISLLESKMVHNIISLEDRKLREVMTPRTVVFSLDEGLPITDAHEAAFQKGFTRIPIYQGDKENITGYVMIHELGSPKSMEKTEKKLSTIARPMMVVSEEENCLTMLTVFLKKRRHIAVVHDGFGGVAGLVTLEDLLETMLGAEIVDETDREVDMQKTALKRKKRQ